MTTVLISAVTAVVAAAARRNEGEAVIYPSKPLTLMVAVAADGIVRRAAISRFDIARCTTTPLSSGVVSP